MGISLVERRPVSFDIWAGDGVEVDRKCEDGAK
jgi:hypothetical protein